MITPKAPPESAVVRADEQNGTVQTVQAGEKVYPDAVRLVNESGETAVLESVRQSVVRSGDDKIFVLDGAVVITRGDRVIRADHVEYDELTGDVTADGHLVLTGGPNHEHLEASHGTLNVKTDTGRFYDVTGSVEMSAAKVRDGKIGPKVYSNGRPFLFYGRIVVKTGPTSYDLYEGTVTSCQLPKPDWLLSADHFSVTDEVARGRNSTFRLLNVPVFYFPYVTHPTDPEARQTGFMIPSIGLSSSRGLTLEEQFYLVLSRSMDLTAGAAYYSKIGWAQDATFRFRGAGLDFVKAHYTGVMDRRTSGILPNGSIFQNEQGEDVLLSLRRDLSSETRLASDLEYLSSYVYREAFTDSFNQAVTSDITSRVYLTHIDRGFELAALVDRYQGIKLIAQGTSPQQQVRIFHAPELAVATTEHRVGDSALEWTLDASADGLKRQQPNFATGGIVERVDIRPEVSLPFHLGEWRFRPLMAMEETAYSRSLNPASSGVQASQVDAALSRTDIHGEVSLRSPVVERVFQPSHWTGVLGSEFKHTVELEATYRITYGVDNFRHTLRFDPIDVVSNTDEMEYGMTQRIFRKRKSAKSCRDSNPLPDVPDADAADAAEADEGGFNPDPTLSVGNEVGAYSAAGKDQCQNDELISWRLTQKYFLDPSFGGAIQNGRRNVFDTTLSLSGVAFLTEDREISPLISRLRVRASSHLDVEWDFDLDTGLRKFTSSNLFLDLHQKNGLFGAMSYARLNAPGRFYTEGSTDTSATGVSTSISDFNQLRVLMGYGGPDKRGLSLAANAGLDLKSITGATGTQTSSAGALPITVYPALLQYATLQVSYNWDCCGLSVEYRKFELGSVRNESSYRFNFTLANIGTAGNLRRAARLF